MFNYQTNGPFELLGCSIIALKNGLDELVLSGTVKLKITNGFVHCQSLSPLAREKVGLASINPNCARL